MYNLVNIIRNYGSAEKPITNKEIASKLKITEVCVRHKINQARCEGIPICSCTIGYFYSEDKEDILETVRSLNGRVISVEKAVSGLLNALSTTM